MMKKIIAALAMVLASVASIGVAGAPPSIIEGAILEDDLPAFFKRKMQGKDAIYGGGIRKGGVIYCIIDEPPECTLFLITEDSVTKLLNAENAFDVCDQMTDKVLGFNLAVRYLESLIAESGIEKVRSRYAQTLFIANDLEVSAAKKLGIQVNPAAKKLQF